jgi:ParB/RepB/Spo0J family partition protein
MSELQVREIDVDLIDPNTYNPNVMDPATERKLEADIKKRGVLYPILVRPKGDRYEIIDGEHRWKTLKKLGHKIAPCLIKDSSDTDARVETLNTNYMRGEAVPGKLAGVLHDLNRTITTGDLAGILPYDEARIVDTLDLLKMPTDIDTAVSAKAAQERKTEPVFISAMIYKETERSLHDFIQQALLEAGATFATIKIKVESPAGKYDQVVEAVQALQVLELADLKNENAPVVTRFALFNDQALVVETALDACIHSEDLGTRNTRGRALELICADYLAGAALPEPDGDDTQ